MERFWLVFPEDPAFPPPHYRTRDLARKEADRLAIINRGQKFFILEAIGYAELPAPKPPAPPQPDWTDLDTEIPF